MKRFLLVFIYVLTTISMDAQNGTKDIVIEWMNVPGQTHYSYITVKWGIKSKSQITDIAIVQNGVSVKGINAVMNDGYDMRKTQVLKLSEGDNRIEIVVTSVNGTARSSRNIVLVSDNNNNNNNDDFGNFENIDSMIIAAYSGEEEAQYLLARSYLYGKNGLAIDLFESSLWFKKSAEHNYSQSQFEYSVALMEGRGIRKNKEAAIYWLKLSTENNCAEAQLKLGLCYEKGDGVPQNIEKAKELYRKCPLAEAKQRLNILEKQKK